MRRPRNIMVSLRTLILFRELPPVSEHECITNRGGIVAMRYLGNGREFFQDIASSMRDTSLYGQRARSRSPKVN